MKTSMIGVDNISSPPPWANPPLSKKEEKLLRGKLGKNKGEQILTFFVGNLNKTKSPHPNNIAPRCMQYLEVTGHSKIIFF